MLKRIVKLLLIVCWMIFIFSFSNDTGVVSTKKSDGLIIRLVEVISNKELSDSEKEKWIKYLVVPVRKSAHLIVYLILGLLIYSFVREFLPGNLKAFLLSSISSFIYAGSDEVHQMFVSGRSGQVSDVFLDMIGVLFGIMIFKLIFERGKKYESKKRIS